MKRTPYTLFKLILRTNKTKINIKPNLRWWKVSHIPSPQRNLYHNHEMNLNKIQTLDILHHKMYPDLYFPILSISIYYLKNQKAPFAASKRFEYNSTTYTISHLQNFVEIINSIAKKATSPNPEYQSTKTTTTTTKTNHSL